MSQSLTTSSLWRLRRRSTGYGGSTSPPPRAWSCPPTTRPSSSGRYARPASQVTAGRVPLSHTVSPHHMPGTALCAQHSSSLRPAWHSSTSYPSTSYPSIAPIASRCSLDQPERWCRCTTGRSCLWPTSTWSPRARSPGPSQQGEPQPVGGQEHDMGGPGFRVHRVQRVHDMRGRDRGCNSGGQ